MATFHDITVEVVEKSEEKIKRVNSWSTIELCLRKIRTWSPTLEFFQVWDRIFTISCVIAVSLDPLFLYIPIVHEDMKCLVLNKELKAIAFVSRSLTDCFYIVDILLQILAKQSSAGNSGGDIGSKKKKSALKHVLAIAHRFLPSYVLVDILAVLPIPQVVISFFSEMRRSRSSNTRKFLNSLVLLQYVPRVLRIFLLRKSHHLIKPIKAGIWIKCVFNFCLYVLASHVLGALWYYFSILRETRCWRSAYQTDIAYENTSFDCNDPQILRNITLLDGLCPTNPPNPKLFDFGLFTNAFQSGMLGSTDFPQKFLICLWWGLRNLSSLGQNLEPSPNAWENLFAISISIIGLLLFLYLIGNLQSCLQFGTQTYLEFAKQESKRKRDIKQKMEMKNLEVQLWLSRKGLPSHLKAVLIHFIQQKLEENKDVDVDNILDVLPSPHSKYIKRYLQLTTLNKVPKFQTMGVKLLKGISKSLEPVEYTEDSYIIREGSRLNKMIFITYGTVHTYETNDEGRKIGYEILEKGDYYGVDELLEWASKFSSIHELPISTRMVKPVTKVEALELSAPDLKSVAIKYWWNFTKKKDLNEFRDQSMLEEFAVSSIEKEIRRRRQGKKKHSIRSLNRLDIQGGSASQKLQKIISKVMRDQVPSPVGALKGC